MAGFPPDLSQWPGEHGAISDGPVDQTGVVAVLEHRPNPLNLVAEGHRSSYLRPGHPRRLEFIGRHVIDQTVEPKISIYSLPSGVIAREGPRYDLAGIDEMLLGGQETT